MDSSQVTFCAFVALLSSFWIFFSLSSQPAWTHRDTRTLHAYQCVCVYVCVWCVCVCLLFSVSNLLITWIDPTIVLNTLFPWIILPIGTKQRPMGASSSCWSGSPTSIFNSNYLLGLLPAHIECRIACSHSRIKAASSFLWCCIGCDSCSSTSSTMIGLLREMFKIVQRIVRTAMWK